MNIFFQSYFSPTPHSFSSHPGMTGEWGKQWIRNQDLPISLTHVLKAGCDFFLPRQPSEFYFCQVDCLGENKEYFKICIARKGNRIWAGAIILITFNGKESHPFPTSISKFPCVWNTSFASAQYKCSHFESMVVPQNLQAFHWLSQFLVALFELLWLDTSSILMMQICKSRMLPFFSKNKRMCSWEKIKCD